ncbi:hypothetical protein [Desulforhopalus sp. IMCC35007]|uniref:hypothetical protein n=1 Tax=Desulforhopalus sp. IMCC35007 TaxID=2569543 RepID=UPI0010ADBE55|nr:hypothetical protein [Desulforhopalus sp. IMCC35007]TKB11373.1 hypothetical protein FCL48_05050 [Desulforhopalus sp. IMCC35007]
MNWLVQPLEEGGDPVERFFFLERPAVGAKLTYEFNNESRTSSGTTADDSYYRYKEQLRFKTEGWLYHPALMQFSLMFEPEWSQGSEESSSGESADINTFSPDYSLWATFLEQKPYTMNIFSSKREIPIWAPFAGNSESTVDTYGATLSLKNDFLPTTIGYSHIETDQTGFYTSQNSYDNFTLAARNQGKRSNTTLNGTYRDDERTTEGLMRQIQSLNTSLLNTYRLNRDNKATLRSLVNYRNQDSDDFDTENIRLKEHLNWWHRKNLQSNYIVSHDRQETSGFNSDQSLLEGRLTHLLYENLTTDVGGRASQDRYADGRENSYEAFLDFAYRRPLSWSTFNLNSGWNYVYTDRGGFTDAVVQVTNELQTLGTGEESFLENYNADINSIIVTDRLGTIVYLENIDYAVEEISDFIRIRLLPFGSIRDGETVAISYRYFQDGEYDDTVLTQHYGINFDLWKTWWLSYDYVRSSQDVSSGQTSQGLVDDTLHRARVHYDIGWSDSSLSYEDSDRQSDLSYTRWEVEETLRFRPHWRFYFSLRGYLGQTDYSNRDEVRDFYGGITALDWMLTKRCKLRFEGYYDATNGDREETINSGIKADLEFRYRIWTMHLSYQVTDQDNRLNDFQRVEQLVRFDLIRILW